MALRLKEKTTILKIQMQKGIQNEILSIRKKPIRLAFSIAVMMAMLLLTALAWDGITKRLIICLELSILSGLLLLLPKLPNGISLPMLAVYLLYVPMKLFERMELPVHNMERITDGIAGLTAAFIICLYLLVFLLTQSSAIALGAGNSLLLVLFLVEYYIWKFRGDFLMPSDFGAAGTAMTVMGNYRYNLSPEALYTVIYFLFFILWGSRIRIRMHKRAHIGVSVAAALFIGTWYHIVMDTEKPLGKEFVISDWNVSETRDLNGACMSYFLLWKDGKVEVPKGYSSEKLNLIAKKAVAEYDKTPQKAKQKPDIIMIMSEAWSDLRVLGKLETTQEYMPFADALKKDAHTISGNLYVSILGGLTANTEFEALTGSSLALLSGEVVPYQNQVSHDMPSLAKVLENQGYETMAMHPSTANAWNRKNVYAFFGFDEFISEDKWEVPYEYVQSFLSDACNYNEIIHRYEARNKNAPFFLFNVTIQNHGSYYGQTPVNIKVTNVGGTPAQEAGYLYDLETYLNLMKLSDNDLKNLITYFEQVKDPVIVCIFGDHQPALSADFYKNIFNGAEDLKQEQNLQKYIAPYLLWANYDVDWKEYGDMSANYLGAALLECAGLELPPFYRYLAELHKAYPVLTKRGCLDQDGNLMNIKDIQETDWISQYRMLQYNQLYVKTYQQEIFEGVKR